MNYMMGQKFLLLVLPDNIKSWLLLIIRSIHDLIQFKIYRCWIVWVHNHRLIIIPLNL